MQVQFIEKFVEDSPTYNNPELPIVKSSVNKNLKQNEKWYANIGKRKKR